MPGDLLRAWISNQRIDFRVLGDIAERFNVSLEALCIRYIKFTTERAILVYWDNGYMKYEWRSVKIAEKTVRTVTVEVEARLVDVETGELLAMAHASGRAKTAEKHAFGGKVGKLADPQAMIEQALAGVGDKLARQLAVGARPRQ